MRQMTQPAVRIMNRILLGVFGCALLAGCLSDRGPRQDRSEVSPKPNRSAAPEHNAHSFGIYLTAGHVDPVAVATNLSALELVAKPVISDADIVAVDLTN